MSETADRNLQMLVELARQDFRFRGWTLVRDAGKMLLLEDLVFDACSSLRHSALVEQSAMQVGGKLPARLVARKSLVHAEECILGHVLCQKQVPAPKVTYCDSQCSCLMSSHEFIEGLPKAPAREQHELVVVVIAMCCR